jgi:TRAP-type transport system periplasmic protein
MSISRILAALSLVAGSLAGAPSAGAAEKFSLTVNVPPNHWLSTEGLEPFMGCVKEATKGDVDFSYFHSGQIASAQQALDAVNSGLVQVAYLVISLLSDKFPLNGISMLPNLGDSVTEMTNANRKVLEVSSPFRKEFTDNRVHPLLINMFPTYQVLSTGAPISTPSEFAGKKIRVSGGSLNFVASSVGATPISGPSSEAYLMLQQKVVDATLLALVSVQPYKLEEVTKSMSTNGPFGSATNMLVIDARIWSKLTPENQKALTDCGLKIEARLAQYLDEMTDKLQAQFAAEGMKMYEFTPQARADLEERLKGASDHYIARLQARGLPAREAYDMYLRALGR